MYQLISEDYLMHHGVKGMKWGVRHDKVTDSDIRRKRAELVKQAPKSDGKRRSTSAPPTKGYWKNAPRSQIERLIIDDRKAERKAEKKEHNKNYSLDQQRRDSRVYGRTGVGRINRHMNKGYSISAARSMESDRINSFRRSARVSGQVGSVIGGVIGSLSGYAIGRNGIKIGRRQYSFKANSPEEQRIVSSAISIGTGVVGKQLGRYGGQSIAMLAGGYSPKKFR